MMIGFSAALLLPVLAGFWGEPQPAPPDALLTRFRAQLSEEMDRAPHYSCLATLDRSIRQSASKKPLGHDRMRLRMAFLDSGELYAWPDSPKFEKGMLALLARGDAGSSNGLSGWGRIAAGLPESSFSQAGECTFNSRRGARYDVHVPWASSSYSATLGTRQLVLAYEARFCVDPVTSEPMSLEVRAENLKPPLASISESITYARTHIGAAERLAPQSRELAILDVEGNLQSTRTTLGDCQVYEDTASSASTTAAAAPAARKLPAKLTLDMKLETPIAFERSMVGDPVSARLQHSIRADGIEVPKGALLNGRIGRLEEQFVPERHYVVGLEFSTVAVDGAEFRFHAKLTGPAISYNRRPDAMLRQDPLMAPVWDTHGLEIDTTDAANRLGVFRVRASKLNIAAGLHMIWETLPD